MALISFDLDGVLQRNPFYMGSPRGVFGHIVRDLAPYAERAASLSDQTAAASHLTAPTSDGTEAANAHAAAASTAPSAAADTEQLLLRRLIQEHRQRMEAGEIVAAHDWEAIVNLIAQEIGYPTKVPVTELVEQYCQVEGLVYAYPGSHQTLDQLLAEGHTLVSITNGFYAYQAPVLRTIGLLDRFTTLITPDRTGAGKPQVAIYRAAESFGSPCVHVGDVLPHDIAGAKAAGWLGIYLVQPQAPGYTPLPPDLQQLNPWERPQAATAWLQGRLEIDRRWHDFPPCELADCIPDAICQHLEEVPATIAHLLG